MNSRRRQIRGGDLPGFRPHHARPPPAEPVEAETVAVEAYNEIVCLCDGSHVTFFEEQLIQGEGATGDPRLFTGILPARPSPSLGVLRVR